MAPQPRSLPGKPQLRGVKPSLLPLEPLFARLERKASGRLPRGLSSRPLLLPEPGHELPFRLPPRSPRRTGCALGPLVVLLLRTSQTQAEVLCQINSRRLREN